jgi:uridine phosphorylase
LPSASRPEVGGRPYHLMVSPGDIAGYVLLPGDPGRVAKIAGYWDEARLVGDHRASYRTLIGIRVSVLALSQRVLVGPPQLLLLRSFSGLEHTPS